MSIEHMELAPSPNRRKAIEFLAAGKPYEATQVLSMIPLVFANTVSAVGTFNIMIFPAFEPIMAVLTDAMVQTGDADYAFQAEEIRTEVEETEAIVSAYWEGVLEGTRRELRERRRDAAALAGGGAGGGGR